MSNGTYLKFCFQFFFSKWRGRQMTNFNCVVYVHRYGGLIIISVSETNHIANKIWEHFLVSSISYQTSLKTRIVPVFIIICSWVLQSLSYQLWLNLAKEDHRIVWPQKSGESDHHHATMLGKSNSTKTMRKRSHNSLPWWQHLEYFFPCTRNGWGHLKTSECCWTDWKLNRSVAKLVW